MWQRLSQAVDAEDFARHWLALQCAAIEHVTDASVAVAASRGGAMELAGVWPAGTTPGAGVRAVSGVAAREGRGVIKRDPAETSRPGWFMAYPITVDAQVFGVVALRVEPESEGAIAGVMRQLQWGCAWLESFIRRKSFSSSAQLATVLQTIAVALEHDHFHAAATAVATEVANRLKCQRLSIGVRRRGGISVAALSHSAEFGEKSNLVRLLGTAMEEAADQQSILWYPAQDPQSRHVLHAHEALSKQHGATYICSVPLVASGELVGAMTLERNEAPFQRHEIELLEHVAALLGPVLHAKWIEDRWLIVKAWHAAAGFVRKLVGPRHVGMKLIVAAGVVAAIFLGVVSGEHRVTADAALEGSIQRSVTAPIAGYIAESQARAGDLVEEGQLLASLDERDFQLERVRWVSEKEKYLREYSRALAEGDRGRVSVLSAQVDQADAQINLLEDQLARTRITAPFAGVVVAGDLSQSLSAPVERGDVLFEIAPLDSYRVILLVDERDIASIRVGQQGELALAGMPSTLLTMEVEKVTPVSVAREGSNYFEVEARLLDSSDLLRPGMEGVGKVAVGSRRLGWIYTHKLLEWLRTTLWTLLP